MPTKKTAAKKAAPKHRKPTGAVKVKMIQSVDSIPGKDTTVYFTDGTQAVVKSGNKLSAMLNKPETVAPHMVKVTISRGTIVDAEVVDTDAIG